MMRYEKYLESLKINDKDSLEKIIEGLINYDSEIHVNMVRDDSNEDFFNNMLLDVPQIFHCDNLEIRYFSNDQATIIPHYSLDKNEYWIIRNKCIECMKNIISQIHVKDNYSIVKKLHDYFCLHFSYKNTDYFSHTIVDPLLHNDGVCDGFSKLFKLFLDMLNIPSIVVYGRSKEDHYSAGTDSGHAWNMVCIDGSWVQLDVTFDICLSQQIVRYDYFCLSDGDMLRDHIIEKKFYVCSRPDFDYYYRNDLIMYTKEQYSQFITEAIYKDLEEFTIKIPYTKNVDKVVNNFITITDRALTQSRSNYSGYAISQNIDQLVFHVIFNHYGKTVKSYEDVTEDRF